MPTLRVLTLAAVLLCGSQLIAQETIPESILLWPNGAPGSEGQTAEEKVTTNARNGEQIVTTVHKPAIVPYLAAPEKNTGVAVIIAPGGGHFQLTITSEGYNVAKKFQAAGINSFVLKNRLARERGSTAGYTVDDHALADMKRAIRLVRSRAEEWKIDPTKVGALGFSAGGELVALAAMKFDNGNAEATDNIEKFGSRPSFQGLIYAGSSGRYEVTEDSPPVFILCGFGDRTDIAEGMADLYLKYKRAKVPAELHIYSEIGHGFGSRDSNQSGAGRWTDRFIDWLADRRVTVPAPARRG